MSRKTVRRSDDKWTEEQKSKAAKDRRERIATAVLAGLAADGERFAVTDRQSRVRAVDIAIAYADALIATLDAEPIAAQRADAKADGQ